METANKTIREYEVLIDAIERLEYGARLSHDEISSIIHVPKQSLQYYGVVNRANKNLLRKQKFLKTIYTVGYEVCKPDDYTNEVIREMRKSRRRAKAAKEIAYNAPIDKMTLQQSIKHRAVSDKAILYEAMSSSAVKESVKINK